MLPQRFRHGWLSLLILVAGLAVLGRLIAFGSWHGDIARDFTFGILCGIGEVQLAVAVYIACTRSPHWSLRMPLSLVLLASGLSLQFFGLVATRYPFLPTENYLLAMLMPLALWVSFARWPMKTNKETIAVPTTTSLPWLQFSLSSLLLWLAGVGYIIWLGQRLLIETDVSGMSDPIETVGQLMPLKYTLPRLPLASLTLIAWAFCFRISYAAMISSASWFTRLGRLLGIHVAFFIAEVILGILACVGLEYWNLSWPLTTFSVDLISLTLSDLWIVGELNFAAQPLIMFATRFILIAISGAILRSAQQPAVECPSAATPLAMKRPATG